MRILVIDDEPDLLLLCRVNLEFDGHEVLEATDGEAGFEVAAREHPDLIFLDLMLPLEDGYTVLGRLRLDPRTSDVPVVLLTAKAREQDQIRGWEAGAADFVTKPFSPATLAECIERITGMTPVEREARRQALLHRLTALDRS